MLPIPDQPSSPSISMSSSDSSTSSSAGLRLDPRTGPNVNYSSVSSFPQSFSNNYSDLEYLTNYTPVLNVTSDKISSSKIKRENEILLYKYYMSKKQLHLSALNANDEVSSPDSTKSFASAKKDLILGPSPSTTSVPGLSSSATQLPPVLVLVLAPALVQRLHQRLQLKS